MVFRKIMRGRSVKATKPLADEKRRRGKRLLHSKDQGRNGVGLLSDPPSKQNWKSSNNIIRH